MRNIILSFFLFGLTFTAEFALAQAVCSSEVTYKWKKAESEESTIHWSLLEQAAVDEASARGKLSAFVVREKKRASEACRELHENLTGCISSKYGSAKDQMASMDFTLRKDLEGAIAADCKQQQGKCREISASEPKCVDKGKEAAAADAGKKEEKGKEKKKK